VSRSHHRLDRWHLHSEDSSESWAYHQQPEWEQSPPDPAASAAKEALAEELLACLTPLQREAIELTVMAGLPHHTAASLVGCSPNAMDKRVERARRTLARRASQLSR
jgi:DNA-directed RNA polymerase specialized sigma24 family protein